MLTHIGCAATSVTVGIVNGGATIRAAVKATIHTRRVASDVYHQPLSWGDRNNGMHTTTIGLSGGTRAVSAASDDVEISDTRWNREILRCAGVVECLMVRKMVRGTACRHRAGTSAASASYKHGSSYADAESITA
jgi:hypothetical protein